MRTNWAVAGATVMGGVLMCSAALLVGTGAAIASARQNATPADGAGASGYHTTKKVKLGGAGGWDYLEVDPATHRLFISRSTHVMVFDPESEKVVGDIPDTDGVHGIGLAGDLKKGFTSNGRSSTSTIFDLDSLKTIGSATTAKGPDAIIYDPYSKRAFTMNGEANSATAIDGMTGNVAGTVDLGGRPEFAAADGKGNIFVNLEDKSALVKFDAKSLKLESTWPLAPCESPSGLAIDAAHEILVVGCHNKLMTFVDGETGKVIGTVPIGQGVDANRFDPGTGYAFASCGDGTLTIAHEDSPTHFSLVETIATQRGARTMALDPTTHNVYLVTAEFGATPAATTENPRPRPAMVPDTFTVIVLSK